MESGDVTHQCAAPRCPAQVPISWLLCRYHWQMVPATIRGRVRAEYRPGQARDQHLSLAYRRAARSAVHAVAEHDVRESRAPERRRIWAS